MSISFSEPDNSSLIRSKSCVGTVDITIMAMFFHYFETRFFFNLHVTDINKLVAEKAKKI